MNSLEMYRNQAGDLKHEEEEAKQAVTLLFDVTSVEEQDETLEIIRELRAKRLELEERRKSVTGPLNHVVKEINSWFKPVTEALQKAEDAARSRITRYLARLAESNKQRLLEAAAAPTVAEAENSLAAIEPIAPLKGAHQRYTWKWRVIDAALVPRDFCSPDKSMIDAFLRQSIKDNQVPFLDGIEFYCDAGLQVNK